MKKHLAVLTILVFLSLAAIIYSWPLVFHLSSEIVDLQDGLLITWFLNWSIFHPLNYNANIFYPYSRTLAYSETMIPEAWIAAPLVFLFKEPLLAYNLNFLCGFIFTGFSVYLLARYLTKKETAGYLAAFLFTFSTYHLNYLSHIQLFNFWPVVFTIYFWYRKNFKTFVLFFLIATLTTALFSYFLMFFLFLCFVFYPVQRRRVLVWTLISAIVSAPFSVPYFLVSREFHYVRPITDVIHFSLAPTDLLTQFNPGILLVIIILGLGIFLYGRKTRDSEILFWFYGTVGSLVLALGPFLHLVKNTVHVGPVPGIPLPYLVFYYLLPGFSGFRTPSRWMLLFGFFLTMTLVYVLKEHLSKRVTVFLLLLLSLGLLVPLKFYPVPKVADFPPEQKWLATHYFGAPLIQFPIYSWNNEPEVELETLREYYSTIHWHPMVNGYSGFSPKEWENRVSWLQKNFPSVETISYLRNLGVKLVLVPVSWQGEMRAFNLNIVANFPKTLVYQL